ncbi:hypothetical protein EHS25_007342 [Saitozyma podzolica]|uniref:galacturonan 1,4-alpha-galacturonidase n=1 Tax=Saitozyma podzolica TaxID=1890683 RepID=A0A427XMM7_9TREE|nr:hypothetical protein EHS25_007342 [Saitozyma podzolica]
MRLEPLFPALATLSLALAGVIDPSIPSAGDLFAGIDHFLHHTPSHPQLLEVHNDYFDITTGKKRKLCVLHPRGDGKHDDQNFKAAVHECGKGGIIRLPDANYTIGNPLVTELHDSVLDLHGWLSFSADIDHWVKHRMPFEFQNLALAWIIKGENYVLDGNDIGGIHGNGQAWDSWAKDESNKYGRPMSFAIVESKNVVVKNWSVIQPQFWASIIIRSENVLYKAYYVNATQHDPGARRHFLSWLQNTDGCDTYKSHNVTFGTPTTHPSISTVELTCVENMVYQGGDNCLALKPNSSMIIAKNVTCFGGTGIAFGSIGQYRDVLDFIEDVQMEDITLLPSTQHLMTNGLYFKSWLGYPIGEPPNGGGGGAGYARNIKIWNVKMEKINRPVFLQSK